MTIADSGQPRVLFETALPPRYYLPLTHPPLGLLRPSATQSHCPYTGPAVPLQASGHDNVMEPHTL